MAIFRVRLNKNIPQEYAPEAIMNHTAHTVDEFVCYRRKYNLTKHNSRDGKTDDDKAYRCDARVEDPVRTLDTIVPPANNGAQPRRDAEPKHNPDLIKQKKSVKKHRST